MDSVKYLTARVKETYRENGIKELAKKTARYVKKKVIKGKSEKKVYKDILFINGCTLPHPSRYRVLHQMEQLNANNITTDTIYYEQLTLEMEKYYRGFVFFRCPITDTVSEFIDKAKSQNKTVFYDIDDLVFDKEYTKTIKHLNNLPKSELDLYYDGVKRMGDTLKKCDYAITTTPRLATELKKYAKEVFINRNVSSERMVQYSLSAVKNIKKDENKVIIGYLSGSITHNADFELIMPTIKKLMGEYNNLYLKVVGLLDIPDELKEFTDRILTAPFVSWEKLPEIIASIDINLAPIEESIFNEAKSENKWMEAALCKIPTVASNFGAFKEVMVDGVDSLLCSNEKEWYQSLKKLIESKELRDLIGVNAQKRVLKEKVSTYTGYGLTKFIKSKLPKCVAFVLPTTNISGGVNVILKHCTILKKVGVNSFIINSDKSNQNIINNDGEIEVISNITDDIDANIDVMVASLWSTLKFVTGYPKVNRKLYLVQNFETDFMKFGDYTKMLANSTYNYDDVEYITISKWCQNWLEDKFERKAKYIPNGIDLESFPIKDRELNHKIKILVEGNSDDYYKNVDESFKIVDKLDKEKFEIHYLSYQGKPKEWYYVDKFMHRVPHDEVGKVYKEADILIKSSILESFSYPPLEMMATGGISIVVPNDGNIEYLKDKYNCLFYKQGNIEEAIDKINKIITDEKLRNTIIKNGIKTAQDRDWKHIEKEIVKVYIGE